MKVYIFFILCCLMSITSFSKNIKNDISIKSTLIDQTILGTDISFVSEIIGDKSAKQKSYKLIYLVASGDSEQLINKGFELFHEIESLDCTDLFVVSPTLYNWEVQTKFNCHLYVYPDENDLFRKRLPENLTPVLLALDKNNVLVGVLTVEPGSNYIKNENQFKRIFVHK